MAKRKFCGFRLLRKEDILRQSKTAVVEHQDSAVTPDFKG